MKKLAVSFAALDLEKAITDESTDTSIVLVGLIIEQEPNPTAQLNFAKVFCIIDRSSADSSFSFYSENALVTSRNTLAASGTTYNYNLRTAITPLYIPARKTLFNHTQNPSKEFEFSNLPNFGFVFFSKSEIEQLVAYGKAYGKEIFFSGAAITIGTAIYGNEHEYSHYPTLKAEVQYSGNIPRAIPGLVDEGVPTLFMGLPCPPFWRPGGIANEVINSRRASVSNSREINDAFMVFAQGLVKNKSIVLNKKKNR